ncbi:glycosyltransferase [Dyella tabacisoli]|uniref:Glycosyltransferase family 1 protein n=1 Tax=Dyella tabacisoli TaxID=2282381 RepID=A0A369UNI6_9GAMM|nr:glycosyltransferase [Dyella tabacisoli]RDD82206.1 glycosyltransferase family 1 protein [Dyella tabacisoli]
MSKLNLIARDNGAGLSRDMRLLADALRACDQSVTESGLPHRGRFAEWMTRLRHARSAPAYDFNLMLERIRPEFLPAAHRNVLIPNPEYFRPEDRAALKRMDAVWVKTRHAEPLFGALGASTRYIGFTSPDRRDLSVARQATFFHGPGRSGNKGTEALLKLWAAHPDWPMLTVVWRRKRVEVGSLPANVTLIRSHLDDASYRRLQNQHRFHLCPSQTEGYGHYLVEAMSCEAVVVTLDAPPMNELVNSERGVLVQAQVIGQQDLATTYGFTGAAMTVAIEHCLAMTEDTARDLGLAARRWYESEQQAFPLRLQAALASAV